MPKNTRRQTHACTHSTRTHAHSLPSACPSRKTLPQDAGARGGARMASPRAPGRPHSPGTLTGRTEMTGPATAERAPPTRNQQPNSAATMALPPRLCRRRRALGGRERGHRGALAQSARLLALVGVGVEGWGRCPKVRRPGLPVQVFSIVFGRTARGEPPRFFPQEHLHLRAVFLVCQVG